jgi:hypothetical protein
MRHRRNEVMKPSHLVDHVRPAKHHQTTCIQTAQRPQLLPATQTTALAMASDKESPVEQAAEEFNDTLHWLSLPLFVLV